MTDSLRISKDVIVQELEGEAVLLNMANGKFFGLNSVGRRMWELLSELGETEKVLEQLLREYEVAENQLRKDLVAFIDTLATRGLLEIR